MHLLSAKFKVGLGLGLDPGVVYTSAVPTFACCLACHLETGRVAMDFSYLSAHTAIMKSAGWFVSEATGNLNTSVYSGSALWLLAGTRQAFFNSSS